MFAVPPRRGPGFSARFSVLALAGSLAAQGKFVNYEDPQVKPVAIATVGAGATQQRYALLCNTPDNSVEIWRTVSPFEFVARAPVGLSPVTVRWNQNGRFYTCNYLGDSVTAVRLDVVPGSGSAPPSVRPVVERTMFVGDQPADIAFVADNIEALVTLDGRSGAAHLLLADLSVITPNVPVLVPDFPAAGLNFAARMPRAMAALPDQRFYVLNHLGGDQQPAGQFDLGLVVADPHNPPAGQTTNLWAVGQIGSTNFNFAIDAAGTRMFVVAQVAMNDAIGVAAVAQQPTGFVQTWLKVVELVPGAPGGPPAVAPEQTAGPGPKPLWRSVNLNRDYAQTALTQVPRELAIAQATDVVLVENENGVQRIVVAAFGSDKVAVLIPDANHPSGYQRRSIAVPIANPAGGYSASGPRGLALDPTGVDPAAPGTRGLVYVLNRLDNSFAVVNPWTARLIAQRALNQDPTPVVIRSGRRFLYSAAHTSGNAMVSCASCHIDARTEGLVWNLGNLNPPGPAIPAHFHDGDHHDLTTMPAWPNGKGLMVTQTLQGLVNSHVEPYEMRFVTTNAPYHWRGDKLDFTDFNEAFVNLLGMPDDSSLPEVNGLTQAQMEAYHQFINTILHPPNPEQLKNRLLGGDLGDADDPATGSGGLLGMKLFHILKTVGPRSCVNCHALPDSSSNTLVLVENQPTGFGTAQDQPFETAATRNLFQRELVVPNGFLMTDLTSTVTVNGPFGLLHAGILTPGLTNNAMSINDFVHRTFGFSPDPAENTLRAAAVTEFVRHFDTGSAPLIGFARTADPAQPTVDDVVFTLLERQVVQANTGLAVFTRNGTVERGYWFDPRDRLFWPEGGGQPLDRPGLLLLAQGGGDNVVIAQATPTGSERRVASLSGVPAILSGSAPVPATIELRPMAPNTFFVGVASLSGNYDPNHPTLPFAWNPAVNGPEPVSLKSMRTLQAGLANLFGLPANPLRHEPPRRLRVVGDNIRPGARLGITLALQMPGSLPGQTIWFDLAPTGFSIGGRTIWETAEELDPMHQLAWLNGGYSAPGVMPVMLADYTQAGLLAPTTWNKFLVTIENEDSTTADSSVWWALTLQDGR